MQRDIGSNDNWTACPRCGSPLLASPVTGRQEKCANCDPTAVRQALLTGGTFLLLGLAATILLVIFAVWLLQIG